jgi:hypothetical protein
MDLDFSLLTAEVLRGDTHLSNEIITRFEDPRFMIVLVECLEQHPTPDDPFMSGLLLSITSMIRCRFTSRDFCPPAFVSDFAARLLFQMFRLPIGHRSSLQAALRILIIHQWPLDGCATFCLEALNDNIGYDYPTAWTAICFLENYFHFFSRRISVGGLPVLASRMVSVLAAHLEQFRDIDFMSFLCFLSPCCRCLAALFGLAHRRDLDLTPDVEAPALEFCVVSSIHALQNDADDGIFDVVKAKARIVKAFSRALVFLFDPSLNECPVNILLCEQLVEIAFEVISSNPHPVLLNSLLVLIQSMLRFESSVTDVISRGFDARVLFAAARLRRSELDELEQLPGVYLDCCLAFCPQRIQNCPRCTLLGIFQGMSPEERGTAAQRIAEADIGSDPADLEIFFFLMSCLVSHSESPLCEAFVVTAVGQLSSGLADSALLAALLTSLTCLHDLNEEEEEILRPQFLELACNHMNSDSLVVRHAALKLLWQNLGPGFLDADNACQLLVLVVDLVQRAWHPHLAPILTALLAFPLLPSLDPAQEIFGCVWTAWYSSEGADPDAFIALLAACLGVLPDESSVACEAALTLGNWFDQPDDTLPSRHVLDVAIVFAAKLTVFPHEFFNVLVFCEKRLDDDPELIGPFTDLCALLVQSRTCLEVAGSCALMLDTCRALLQTAFTDACPADVAPGMLLVIACFVQARGPEAVPLVHEVMPFFRERTPGDLIWSAALIVILSGVFVAPYDASVLDDLLLLDDELDSWHLYGDSEADSPYNRLSVLSIVGFAVLAMAGKVEACPRFVRQMGHLTSHRQVDALGPLDALSLPSDQIDIATLMGKFTTSYP